jgi:4-hydroxybenzoate polyprenyltransferase
MKTKTDALKEDLLVRWRAGDYIDLARPFTLLAPIFGFLAGAVIALAAPNPQPPSLFIVLPLVMGAAVAAILNAGSNTINQVYDLEADRVNKPNRPLPSGRLTVRKAWIFGLFCYVVALGLSWLIPNKQFFWVVLVGALLTYAYSAPPLRTKRFPWLANLTMALPRGCLVVVAGWAAVRDIWNAEPWFIGAILGLYVFGASSTKDFSDMEGDKLQGVRTLPNVYGVEQSVYFIAPFFVVPFMLLPYGLLFGLLTGPPFLLSELSLILAAYGGYILYLILRDPKALATEANHVSWKHMYLLLLLAQVGIAVCYIFAMT